MVNFLQNRKFFLVYKFFIFLFFIHALITPSFAVGESKIIAQYVPNAEPVGAGRLSVMFWDIYDAVLYAADGAWDANKPYALSISYLRKLKGAALADRSITEIRNHGFQDEDRLHDWRQKMIALFPDVDAGSTLTGIRDQNGAAIFYHNEQRLGIINDSEFSDWFFGIWLNEKTSEPEIRKKLLGIIK